MIQQKPQRWGGWWFSETNNLCNTLLRMPLFFFLFLFAWIMFVQRRRTLQVQLFRVQWSQKKKRTKKWAEQTVNSIEAITSSGRERFQEQQKRSMHILCCNSREVEGSNLSPIHIHWFRTMSINKHTHIRYRRNSSTCWHMQSSVFALIAYRNWTAGRTTTNILSLIDILHSALLATEQQ